MARNTKNSQTPTRGFGIPRTHKVAQNRGYTTANLTFADLGSEHKASFIQLEGGRAGSVCGVGPSPDPNYWLVCYKDQNGQCSWVQVPRGAPLQAHS
jgi:hypothetical protein